MSATDELLRLLDEFEHECYMLRVEASETRAKDELVRDAYELQREKTAKAIVSTLGDDDYESRMDELLCRLTNGKWSKSRSYSVDFMVGCVDEAYEDATLGGGECELAYGENDEGIDGWYTHCGGWFAATRKDGRMVHPLFCQLCGSKAVER